MAQWYFGSILEYTYHIILGPQFIFAVLIKTYGFGPGVITSLKHCTGLWLLAQAALPAKIPPNGPLRDSILITHKKHAHANVNQNTRTYTPSYRQTPLHLPHFGNYEGQLGVST